MKKIIAMLLVLIMALGFAGCGNKGEEEGVTLTWYMPASKQADTQLVCEEVNKIIEPKIGAKIDIQYIESSEFTTKLQNSMASQEEFDLCFAGSQNPYLPGARRGGFLEISELLDEYGKEVKEVVPEYLWEAARIDGEIYAVPNYQAMTKCRAVYFQKDLVEKYNFDVSTVKTMEDIEPFLQAIRDNETEYFPILKPDLEYFYEDPYRYEETSINNVLIDRQTQEIVFAEDVPEREIARQKMKEWYDKGYIRKDIAVAQATAQTAYACWTTTGYRPGDVQEREDSYGVDIVAAPLTDFYLFRSGANTTMTAISATSKHPEKAMQFLNLVNTDPVIYNLVAYGIEGKHYEMVDDKHIRKIEDSGYNPGGVWKFGCMFNGYLLEGVDDDLWDQIKKINDESTKGILNGFVADTDSVNTILSQMTNIISEFKELNNGTSADLGKRTSEFNQKLDAAGKAELMEFAKKEIGEYLK